MIEGCKKESAFVRLMHYAKPYAGRLVFCVILVLVITALELYKPILLGDVIDMFVAGAGFDGVLRDGIIYIIVLILLLGANMLQSWYLQLTGQQIVYNIRQELMAHIHSLSLKFFDVSPVGMIVTRVTNDVEALSEMFSGILVRLVKNVAMILGLAGVMVALNPKLSLRAFILVPVIVVLTFVFRKLSRTCHRIARAKITALNIYLSEHLSGMKLIQVFSKEKAKNDEFKTKSEDLYRANFRELMVYAIFRPSINLLYNLALINIIIGGTDMVLLGNELPYMGITVGTLYIFIKYVGSFFDPIQDLAEQIGTLQQAIASAEKIFTIFDEKPLIKNPIDPVKPERIRGRIEFEHVWFAYNDEDWVLKDVSFVIEPGKKVAFVGATGAGKTTILSLVGRYYDIQKGRITIDGVDIRDLDKDTLRHSIGQVQQDVFIFTGDIAANIRLYNEDISDEEVIRAAKIANADSFIDKLPLGYHEPVAERGSTLSAGERQLLSFARTLAYDPGILVMDEATANIDTETELLITDALQKLMSGRTTIMVAHRLSTIQHCDTIMVMHHGELRESGTHQELLAKGGIYKKLYELQKAAE